MGKRRGFRAWSSCLLAVSLCVGCAKGKSILNGNGFGGSAGPAADGGGSNTQQDGAIAGSGGTGTGSAGTTGSSGTNGGASDGGAADSGIHFMLDGATGDSGAPTVALDPHDFTYKPVNVDRTKIDFSKAPAAKLDCGMATIDTTGSGAITAWCGTKPSVTTQMQGDGSSVIVIGVTTLEVATGTTLKLTGDKPVVLLAAGDVLIAGTIDASAKDQTPGPGGNVMCGASVGGDAMGETSGDGSGGGGGGHASAGGAGGQNHSYTVGTAGMTRGTATLVPLVGGCPGGVGGGGGGAGGAGGGALQLSAAGKLTVTGKITVAGAKGATNSQPLDCGGGGGGSGGGILLEGDSISAPAATVIANGGDGGKGNNGQGGGKGATSAAMPGAEGGSSGALGAGGGGGGYGRVVQ